MTKVDLKGQTESEGVLDCGRKWQQSWKHRLVVYSSGRLTMKV